MPGFLTPKGISQMELESSQLEKSAFWNALVGNAYLDEPENSFKSHQAAFNLERVA